MAYKQHAEDREFSACCALFDELTNKFVGFFGQETQLHEFVFCFSK